MILSRGAVSARFGHGVFKGELGVCRNVLIEVLDLGSNEEVVILCFQRLTDNVPTGYDGSL